MPKKKRNHLRELQLKIVQLILPTTASEWGNGYNRALRDVLILIKAMRENMKEKEHDKG